MGTAVSKRVTRPKCSVQLDTTAPKYAREEDEEAGRAGLTVRGFMSVSVIN